MMNNEREREGERGREITKIGWNDFGHLTLERGGRTSERQQQGNERGREDDEDVMGLACIFRIYGVGLRTKNERMGKWYLMVIIMNIYEEN